MGKKKLEKKLQIYNPIVKSTITYGAETWKFKKNLASKQISMEIHILRNRRDAQG